MKNRIKLFFFFLVINLFSMIFSEKIFGQGVTYNSNTFWVCETGVIKKYEILNNQILSIGTAANLDCVSLAFCDNLNGGNLSPTFYTNGIGSSNSADYFDGSNWVEGSGQSSCVHQNCGGFGSYLYYQTLNENPNCIERYDGSGFFSVFTEDTLFFRVADLAVDEDGNIWCLMGPSTNPNFCEYLRVYSPTGVLLKQYEIYLNTYNTYGCFLLNNIFYVGFGVLNTTYPSTLLPISFSDNAALVGTPIPTNFSNPYDLASANPGKPLAFTSTIKNSMNNKIDIYPTIISHEFNCVIESETQSTIVLSIFDEIGQKIYQENLEVDTKKFVKNIDLAKFSNGIYYVQLESKDRNVSGKIIKK